MPVQQEKKLPGNSARKFPICDNITHRWKYTGRQRESRAKSILKCRNNNHKCVCVFWRQSDAKTTGKSARHSQTRGDDVIAHKTHAITHEHDQITPLIRNKSGNECTNERTTARERNGARLTSFKRIRRVYGGLTRFCPPSLFFRRTAPKAEKSIEQREAARRHSKNVSEIIREVNAAAHNDTRPLLPTINESTPPVFQVTLERPAPVLHFSAAADLTQRFNEATRNQPPAPTNNDLVAFINEFSIDETTMERDEQQREDPNSGAPSNDNTAPNDTTMVISSDDNDELDGAAPNVEVLAPPNPAPPVQPAPFEPPVPIATSTQLPVMAAVPPPRPAALFQQRSPMTPFQQRPPTAPFQRSTATLIPQLQFAFGGAPLQPMQARTLVRPLTPVTPLALSTAIAATATATMAASATYEVTSSGLSLPAPPPEYETISPPDDNNSAPRKRRRRDDAAAQEQADEEREHDEYEREQEHEEEDMDAETEAPENAPTTSHDTAPAHAITDFGRATLTIMGGEDVVADGVNFSDRNALLYVESHVLGRFPEAVRFVLMGMARLFGATSQTVPGQAYGGPPESASYIIFGTDTARIRRGAPLLHAPARAHTLTSRLRPNAEARLPVPNSDATVISLILIRLADPAILDRLPAWVTDAAAGFVGVIGLAATIHTRFSCATITAATRRRTNASFAYWTRLRTYSATTR